MKYNKLGKSGLCVSEVGLGCEHLEGKDYKVIESVVNTALDAASISLTFLCPNPMYAAISARH